MAKPEKKDKAAEAKAEKERKRVEAEERKNAVSGYQERLTRVHELKAMTDTKRWQKFYAGIQKDIERHAREVLDAEKTRDVLRHQEGVKILRAILDNVSAPVGELQSYINDMPLFAQGMKTRAKWNAGVGIVELSAA